jgi:hypothetical protein
MGGMALEILGQGLPGDLLCVREFEKYRIELEFASIGGEEEFTAWSKQAEAGLDQARMITLSIQDLLHLLRVGEAGRV